MIRFKNALRTARASRRLPLLELGLTLWASLPMVAAANEGIRFEEVGEAAGLRLTHTPRSFGEGKKADVLGMFTDGGAAVAVGDFDGDGHDDLFLTDSAQGKASHLLRNVSTVSIAGEPGKLRFEEVAGAAGMSGGNDASSIVADALWVDFDDDGRLDLLVSRFGTPLLYRNEGPGEAGGYRFTEVGAAAGLQKFGNTIAAIAFDYDGDGWLDLLFGNYFKPVNLLHLEDPHVLPEDLDNAHNGGGLTLWHNVAGGSAATGGRRFVETTKEAGLAGHDGWSLDLGHGDLDNDGDQDVYVASDYGTDRLYLNRGDGTFEDATERMLGRYDTRKGMNVAMADYDHNGLLDVYITNITDEYMRECNMFWHNAGKDGFLDVARETGTCDSDWGWAAQFADFDNDGWEDLFVVNGLRSAGEQNYIPVLLEMIITPGIDFSDVNSYPDIGDMTWSGYQAKRLFRNHGDGTFGEVAAEAGVANKLDGRGIGIGDFDDDGRLDIVQTNARGRPLLYHNTSESADHWIELRLRGAGVAQGIARQGSNRNAIGARVVVTTRGGLSVVRQVDGGNGYAGQVSSRLHFGLGDASTAADLVQRVEIRWPSGRVEVLQGSAAPPLPVDRISVIAEGQGLVR